MAIDVTLLVLAWVVIVTSQPESNDLFQDRNSLFSEYAPSPNTGGHPPSGKYAYESQPLSANDVYSNPLSSVKSVDAKPSLAARSVYAVQYAPSSGSLGSQLSAFLSSYGAMIPYNSISRAVARVYSYESQPAPEGTKFGRLSDYIAELKDAPSSSQTSSHSPLRSLSSSSSYTVGSTPPADYTGQPPLNETDIQRQATKEYISLTTTKDSNYIDQQANNDSNYNSQQPIYELNYANQQPSKQSGYSIQSENGLDHNKTFKPSEKETVTDLITSTKQPAISGSDKGLPEKTTYQMLGIYPCKKEDEGALYDVIGACYGYFECTRGESLYRQCEDYHSFSLKFKRCVPDKSCLYAFLCKTVVLTGVNSVAKMKQKKVPAKIMHSNSAP